MYLDLAGALSPFILEDYECNTKFLDTQDSGLTDCGTP